MKRRRDENPQTSRGVQRLWIWTATHLFRNYIRRGVAATRSEFIVSLLFFPGAAFFYYLLTAETDEPVPWAITTPVFQIMVVLFPWVGGLLAFGYLFGRRFGYEPLRDVDMMAAGRSGGHAAAAAAGVATLSRLIGQLWGG